MTDALLPTEALLAVDEQCLSHTDAIGAGVERSMIDDVYSFAKSARIHDKFVQYAEIRFVYEMLLMEDGRDKVSALVDSWVDNEENVLRAARHVGRVPTLEGQALVCAFCIFKLKAFDGQQWEFLDDHGLHSGGHSLEKQRPQTVVFIALTELNRQNGFFMDLNVGQDVCIDSAAGLLFPPQGGGLGVCLCLNL